MWCILILMLAVSSYVDSSAMDSSFSSAASRSSRQKIDSEPWKKPYLPNTMEPVLYNLTIRPDFNNTDNSTAFNGVVSIELKVHVHTQFFIVHAKQLDINSTQVFDKNGAIVRISSAYSYVKNDYWVITTRRNVTGKVTLLLSFKGNMTTVRGSYITPSGLFKIPYFRNPNNKQSWLWVTNFRPSNARMVFPCFDEPRHKAKFRITVRTNKPFTALSNMPYESNRLVDNLRETTFKLSPKMCSYHVAFAITDFAYKNRTVNGIVYRVFARPDVLAQVDYALNVTPTIQGYLEKELNITYPLKKLDQLAVPGYLLTGATENWGLITYRESSFLVDKRQDDADAARFNALKLIANALAHNYFGNLVTCRTWDHVWLNEGLSKFYELRVVSKFDPTFHYNETFYGWALESLMDADAENKTNALLTLTDASIAAQPRFDDISIVKGAAIVRMAENIVKPDRFKRGIIKYLKDNAHGTVETNSLWNDLENVMKNDGNISFKKVISNWVKKNGFPVVSVKHYGNGVNMIASHKQFWNKPMPNINNTNTWFVLLDCTTKGGVRSQYWLNRTSTTFPNQLRTSDDWVDFNVDRAGYYRVNYDAIMWDRIVRQLNENHIRFKELTRSKFLGDALALAKAEELGFDAFLNLTKYASGERDLAPWLHLYQGLGEIPKMFNASSLRPFKNYTLGLTSNLMDKLQVKRGGSYIEKLLRPYILTLSCAAGYRRCIENTTRVFKAWLKNATANAVPKNIKRQVYCNGIANSVNETEWNITYERFTKETSTDERNNLRQSLCCTINPIFMERLLNVSVNTSIVSDADRTEIMFQIASNPYADNYLWKWFKLNYAEVLRVKGAFTFLMTLLRAVSNFNTREQYQEVLDFYKVYTAIPDDFKAYIKKDLIDPKIHWMDRNYGVITTFLENNI